MRFLHFALHARAAMSAAALALDEYVARLKHRDERGRALVVRNGHAKARRVTVGVWDGANPSAARK